MVQIITIIAHFVLGLLLLAGSFFHFTIIFGLYLSFPTNIFIKTNFETLDKQLPALTFCANIWNVTRGRPSQQTFSDFYPLEIIVDISTSYFFDNQISEENLRKYFLSNILETLSLRYYCFPINNHIKGIYIE